MSVIYQEKQFVCSLQHGLKFYVFIILLTFQSTTVAVTLDGSSDYAVPGNKFSMICNIPEEAYQVQLYRRPNTTPVGSIQVGGGQCYNIAPVTPVVCGPDVCSCTTTSDTYGTEFQWVIQPQTGDHGSVWYCRRVNPSLPEADRIVDSNDYTLNVADAVTLSGSSEYAVPGVEFRMKCNIPGEANQVQLYRRPNVTPVGGIQVGGGQCYNIAPVTPVVCDPDVCSCTTTSDTYGTVFQWVIQPQTGDHGSVWYCRRINPSLPEADRIAESDDYTLNVADDPGTPTLSPPDFTYTRSEGDTLPDITCTADCRPGCTFVWTKPDNINLTASAVLSLGQLDRSEHGTYRCIATNDFGSSTISVLINVQYGPSTPTLSPQDKTYTTTEGDRLPDITCTADCRPGCTFVWTKPDNTNFTASPVLSLGQLDRSKYGTYRCTARNVVAELSTTVTVNILYGPGLVRLNPSTSSYTITKGQTLSTIRCLSDCNPACTYRWTKDGQSYTTGSDLRLTNIRSQAGVYRCIASNSYGSQTSSDVRVTVNYGPSSVTLSPPDTTYTRTEGDTLPDITCTADCRPGCTFVWTKPDNTNFTASPVLSLGQLERSEHGTYRCTAKNVVGESITNVIITVIYGPGVVILSPPDTTYTRTEGDSLPDVTCIADCRPGCTFVWTKPDNTNFTASPVLSLGQLDRSEHGIYTCTGLNNVGASKTATNVIIQYGPGNSLMFEPIEVNVERVENQTVPDINCTADCRPVCMYNWSKSGEIRPNPLTLLKATRNNAGTYTCIAYNVISQETKNWNLVVKFLYKPEPPVKLVISQVTSSSAVLSWESRIEQDNFKTFRLTYQKHEDLSTTYVTLNKTTTTFMIERLLPSTQYDVSVVAVNAEGTSEALTGTFVTRESHITGDGAETTGNTGVVLISVGSVMILISLSIFAVTIFMLRKGRLPYGRQNTADKSRPTNKPHNSEDIGGFGQERYEDLDLEQIEPPSEYDEVTNHPLGNDYTTTGNTSNVYEHLQRQSAANTYEDIPPKPGSGSDGLYVNTSPN